MDKLWFYARKGSSQQGPVPDGGIRALIQRGEIQREDLVWSEGMKDWVRADTQPGWFETAAAVTGDTETAAVAVLPETPAPADNALPGGLLGWMTFNGVMNIILGVLGVFTCFGLPTGVLMIVGGVALTGGRTALEHVGALQPETVPFFKKLRTFLMMMGIMYILSAIGMIVGLLLYVGIIASVISASGTGLK